MSTMPMAVEERIQHEQAVSVLGTGGGDGTLLEVAALLRTVIKELRRIGDYVACRGLE